MANTKAVEKKVEVATKTETTKVVAEKPVEKKAEVAPAAKKAAAPVAKKEAAPVAKKEAAPAVKKEAAPAAKKEAAPAAKKEAAPTAKKAAAPAAKKAVAPAAKKAPAKKAEPKTSVTVEFMGKAIATKDVVAAATKAFTKANKGVEIKTLDVYVKPEESVAYYVVNGVGSDDYKIIL